MDQDGAPLLSRRVSTKASTVWRFIRKLSPLPEEATRPKWNIIFLVVLCLSSCVVNITMLFAYLPQMMRDLGYAEQALGVYAGMVASSYFVGAFLSSNFWGIAADTNGRRPVIVICLFGTAVCTLCFGFSFNIYWAIVSRFLVGVFNGIIGTTKAILGDVSDDSNQAVGLALLSVGWGSGLLLGPTIGGHLSEPAQKFAFFAAKELKLFESYPYLLPNMLSAIACLIMFVITLVYLPETKNIRSANQSAVFADHASSAVAATKKPLIVNVEAPAIVTVQGTGRGICRAIPIEVNEACLTGTSAVMKSEPAIIPVEKAPPDAQKTKKTSLRALCSMLADHKVGMATALFSIFSFSCVALDESIPLWAATNTTYGGLGFTTSQLGTMTGAFNVPCLLMNILVFPKLEKWFGCVRTFCVASFVLFVTTIAIPFLTEFLAHCLEQEESDDDSCKYNLWLALMFVLIPNRMTYPICWSAADILINNSVYPEHLGLVNGLSMTFSFLARSASPLAAGSIFSWSITTGFFTWGFPFGHHFVFFVIDVTILICFFIGLFTPLTLDKQPETWDLMEKLPSLKAEDLLTRLKQNVGGGGGSRAVDSVEQEYSVEKILESHEAEQRKIRLFRASFSNSLSYQGPMTQRPLRHFSGSVTEDSSTNASRFLSARENVTDDEKVKHDPQSPTHL